MGREYVMGIMKQWHTTHGDMDESAVSVTKGEGMPQ